MSKISCNDRYITKFHYLYSENVYKKLREFILLILILLNGKVHQHVFTIELFVFLGEQAEDDPVYFVLVVGKKLSSGRDGNL